MNEEKKGGMEWNKVAGSPLLWMDLAGKGHGVE